MYKLERILPPPLDPEQKHPQDDNHHPPSYQQCPASKEHKGIKEAIEGTFFDL